MDHLDSLLAAHGGVLLLAEHRPRRSSLSRACRVGRLATVLPGVYVDSRCRADFRVRALAVLRRYPDAVLCDTTAARLTFWPELRINTVHAANVRARYECPGFTFSRRAVPAELIGSSGPIRLTLPALTAVDLAERTGGDSIDRALRARSVTVAELNAALASTAGRVGNRARRRLLLESRDEPWSAAERLAHRILRSAGIRGWVANYPISIRQHRYFLDIAFPGLRVVIEIDGRLHERDPVIFESDRVRQNDLVLAGWHVLRFTWRMLVDNPENVVWAVRHATASALATARCGRQLPAGHRIG